ncbi:hypothetical protein DPMN_099492 [Dreissena polymorpha]|uniref:Uncharacterized protein n=1 Tax=Dreissena polymorpha TaxID=45954 RepID=A0A9D4LE07_DREPO|nr:hypothetical protein DPMN_099492 [Dreissena polymorpha]
MPGSWPGACQCLHVFSAPVCQGPGLVLVSACMCSMHLSARVLAWCLSVLACVQCTCLPGSWPGACQCLHVFSAPVCQGPGLVLVSACMCSVHLSARVLAWCLSVLACVQCTCLPGSWPGACQCLHVFSAPVCQGPGLVLVSACMCSVHLSARVLAWCLSVLACVQCTCLPGSWPGACQCLHVFNAPVCLHYRLLILCLYRPRHIHLALR